MRESDSEIQKQTIPKKELIKLSTKPRIQQATEFDEVVIDIVLSNKKGAQLLFCDDYNSQKPDNILCSIIYQFIIKPQLFLSGINHPNEYVSFNQFQSHNQPVKYTVQTRRSLMIPPESTFSQQNERTTKYIRQSITSKDCNPRSARMTVRTSLSPASNNKRQITISANSMTPNCKQDFNRRQALDSKMLQSYTPTSLGQRSSSYSKLTSPPYNKGPALKSTLSKRKTNSPTRANPPLQERSLNMLPMASNKKLPTNKNIKQSNLQVLQQQTTLNSGAKPAVKQYQPLQLKSRNSTCQKPQQTNQENENREQAYLENKKKQMMRQSAERRWTTINGSSNQRLPYI